MLKATEDTINEHIPRFRLASLSLSHVAALSTHNLGSVMNDTTFRTAITKIQNKQTKRITQQNNVRYFTHRIFDVPFWYYMHSWYLGPI